MTSGGSTPIFRQTTRATAVVFNLSFCRHLDTNPDSDGSLSSTKSFNPCLMSEKKSFESAAVLYSSLSPVTWASYSGNLTSQISSVLDQGYTVSLFVNINIPPLETSIFRRDSQAEWSAKFEVPLPVVLQQRPCCKNYGLSQEHRSRKYSEF